MKDMNEMRAENGFGFASGKKYFSSIGVVVSNFEYRKAGAKDGSKNWPVLRVRFSEPESTKYFEEDLNIRNAMTPSDVAKLEGKKILDFAGYWGIYVEKKMDPATGETRLTETIADFPKVTELVLEGGEVFKPSGDKIEFGGVGYVAE